MATRYSKLLATLAVGTLLGSAACGESGGGDSGGGGTGGSAGTGGSGGLGGSGGGGSSGGGSSTRKLRGKVKSQATRVTAIRAGKRGGKVQMSADDVAADGSFELVLNKGERFLLLIEDADQILGVVHWQEGAGGDEKSVFGVPKTSVDMAIDIGDLTLSGVFFTSSINVFTLVDWDGDGKNDFVDDDDDNDGIVDATDTDDDGDGTADADEDWDLDNDGEVDWVDTDMDGDGTDNADDADDDGDGIADDDETDQDGDGIADAVDDDDDNDGIPDSDDEDDDGDGVPDSEE